MWISSNGMTCMSSGWINWNISQSILIFPLLTKVRWWKFLCTLYRQLFVQSTCLNWSLKIQFLVILNAACSVWGFWLIGCRVFVVFWGYCNCNFSFVLEFTNKVITFFKRCHMTNHESGSEHFNKWLLIAHDSLSLFQTVCSCDSPVKLFIMQLKREDWWGL